MYEALFDARNETNFETSSALPNLFSGMLFKSLFFSFSLIYEVISVSINPGAIQLTVIFLDPNSFAKDLVNPFNAAFDDE